MNYEGLKKLVTRRVNLWPRPWVMPGGREAQMQWLVNRVDRKERVTDLLAPSGHIKNLASVINHYDEAGNTLVLDAQLVIDGGMVVVEPRPFGATSRSLRRRQRRRRLRSPVQPIGRAPEPTPILKDVLALVGLVAIAKAIADLWTDGAEES